MNKYNHKFTLAESTSSMRLYRAEGLSLRLDFLKDMLRVAIVHDEIPLVPTFTVCPEGCECTRLGRDKLSTEGFEPDTPAVINTESGISFTLGAGDGTTKFDVTLPDFSLKATSSKGLLFSDREYIAYNFGYELGSGSTHFITREENEKIYGVGDKTGPVNKNKMSFRLCASDAMGFDARSSDPLYKQVPFYICENSAGSYGIYYDTYSNGELNFGKEINNYYNPYKAFRCEEENLVFYIFTGSVPEIVRAFSKLCGKPLFPPLWTLKYCGSTMAYTDAPNADEQLRNFVALCEKYDIHPGGFYLSSGYTQIGEKRCVFHWNTDKVPSPEGLSAYFKDHGIEFLPNIKPAFLTEHPLYNHIAEKGWFLHYEDGTPAIFPFWSGYGSYLDFTNPEAYNFWRDCVKEQLIDKGYKNPWNDNNEYDICDTEVWAHGFGAPIRACRIRPLFSMLMTMSSLEAQDKSTRTASVSRCGIAGLQRIATTWTGDNRTSFEDFRYNHKMAMTMSLSGFYNFGQDIGGFAGPCPGRELFIRWIQYGLFTPRFVLHSWNSDGSSTMPWLYPELIPQVQALFKLRTMLLPYLYNELYRSTVTNDPIIYPVFLKYPEADCERDDFFFGDSILACPVFDEGASVVTVDLPENNGGWYLKDTCYEGGANVTFDAPLSGLPVWLVKAGSVIPVYPEGDETKPVEYRVYPLENGTFTTSVFTDDGVSRLDENKYEIIKFTVECCSDAVKICCSKPQTRITVIDKYSRKVIF